MKVYFNNKQRGIKLLESEALYASLEQVLEIFSNLNGEGGSFLCLLNEKSVKYIFKKYNKFVWEMETIGADEKFREQDYYPKSKCVNKIKELYQRQL